MNCDVGFGQYYEGNSLIHRLDPRAKLFFVIIYIVAIFLARDVYGFIPLGAIILISVIISRVPFRVILKGLKPLIFIILFTAILNVFWSNGVNIVFQKELIPNFWTITLYREGFINAGILALRITLLLVATTLFFSYTTTPIALTDGIESALSPLKLIKIPIHEFAMMMTIALRFIPTLVEETTKIMNAQKARGADFSSGGLIKKAKALIPIIIPLFVSAFRRADELATAMECRCYRGGKGRTKMRIMKMKFFDYLWMLLGIGLMVGVILLNIYGNGYRL